MREFVKDLDLGLTSDQIDQYFTQIITQNIEPSSWVQEAQEQITFEATEKENIMNQQEDKGLSQLQKETYQAEIEKHKITNEELKASIERSEARALETENVKLQDEIEELQEELEDQKSITESLRNNIHNAYQKDLERYRKIIDMLLEQLDKQENE